MKNERTVLVVDDEVFVRESLVDLLRSEGYRPVSAGKVEDAVKLVEAEPVIAVITDLKMPGGGGLDLLRELKKLRRDLPVIVLTGVGTIDDAVTAMKSGAYDFIQKPVNPDEFTLLLRRATEHQDLVREVSYLRAEVNALRAPSELIGESSDIREVRRLVAQVAPTDLTVLLTGESGTGKELVAAEVHRQSARAEKNFVRVNCAAITETLFESEFFGHRRGSSHRRDLRPGGRLGGRGRHATLDEIGVLAGDAGQAPARPETGEYQVVGESRTRSPTCGTRHQRGPGGAGAEGVPQRPLYRLNVFLIAAAAAGPERTSPLPITSRKRARPPARRRPSGPCSIPTPKRALRTLAGNVRELRNVRSGPRSRRGGPDAARSPASSGGRPRGTTITT